MIDRSIVGYVGRRATQEVGPCFSSCRRAAAPAANHPSHARPRARVRRRRLPLPVPLARPQRAMNTGICVVAELAFNESPARHLLTTLPTSDMDGLGLDLGGPPAGPVCQAM